MFITVINFHQNEEFISNQQISFEVLMTPTNFSHSLHSFVNFKFNNFNYLTKFFGHRQKTPVLIPLFAIVNLFFSIRRGNLTHWCCLSVGWSFSWSVCLSVLDFVIVSKKMFRDYNDPYDKIMNQQMVLKPGKLENQFRNKLSSFTKHLD